MDFSAKHSHLRAVIQTDTAGKILSVIYRGVLSDCSAVHIEGCVTAEHASPAAISGVIFDRSAVHVERGRWRLVFFTISAVHEYTAAAVVPGDGDATVDAFRRALREETRLVVCTHVSNVWGVRLPIGRIAALAHQYGIPVCVDAAQSAGLFPVFLEEDGIDYVCAAPHKGLYAPMGTGLLLAADGSALDTILEGGTGTNSVSLDQPGELPERLESGTINVPGVAGLRAGLAFVRDKGTERILTHEVGLMRTLHRALARTNGVELFTPEPDGESFAPVVSFRVRGVPSEETASLLASKGIAVRAGLHCAPCAHRAFGTLDSGTVRVCPSAFTTGRDVQGFVEAMRALGRNSHAVHKEKL